MPHTCAGRRPAPQTPPHFFKTRLYYPHIHAGSGASRAGDYGTIPGGFDNQVTGRFSFAAGRRARVLSDGSFAWADSTDADFIASLPNTFIVRATGGVGIGTPSPEGPLHVLETSAGAVTANVNSIAVFERSTGGWLSILSGDDAQRGILFTEPSSAVAGAIIFDEAQAGANGLGFRTGGNNTRMTLDASGNLSVDGAITGATCCAPSDARFKRNISTIPHALKTIENLRGVNYEWERERFIDRAFPAGQQVGLIAQEVREVVP